MENEKKVCKMYTATHLANYFIKNIKNISNIKLIKLVYIAYGVSLAKYDIELFHEGIQAWRLGPVIPSIYHEFKKYGYSNIEDYSYFFEPITDKKVILKIDEEDKQTNEILEAVVAIYGNMSVGELIGRTHNPDTPWSKTYKAGEYDREIDKDDIKEYYQALLT